MINIVFEGSTGVGKTTMIKKLKDKYSKSYKVGFTNDIDKSSPLYNVINDMFKENVLVTSHQDFNTTLSETLIQGADYLYLREKLYSENNDINFFDRNYASIYAYQKVLLKKAHINNLEEFMNHFFKCLTNDEKKIDLLVFFNKDMNKSLKISEQRDHRKYTIEEKNTLKEFNKELIDFIRYHNSDYKLLVIDDKDSYEQAYNKIVQKIDEIIVDSGKNEDDKWYELYKIDIEEFKCPDDYFIYKLKYKKKFVKTIQKYALNKKVLEAGCGTGLMAGYLQKIGLDVTALDLSKKVLDYAKEIALSSKVITPCKYEVGNILHLKYRPQTFDVAYSNGVLEHFNDEEIIQTLKEQMKIAKYVVFGIPSTYFNLNEKMLGNERSLTKKEWYNLIKKAGGIVVEHYSFHYYKFYRRLFEVKKWFKPKAFWLFVITNDIIKEERR